VLAWNDFHGNLEANAGLNIYGQFAVGRPGWPGGARTSRRLRARQVSVIAGDNIGASPLVDGLFFGEPSTIVDEPHGRRLRVGGNHEFDKGKDELLRIQNGGCRKDVGCTAAPVRECQRRHDHGYPGADFQYLSANVTLTQPARRCFRPSARRRC
jgi:5'-nucleotidase